MKTWKITAPIAGVVNASIDAETPEKAMEILQEHWYEGVKLEEVSGEGYWCDVEQLDVYQKVIQGNVVYLDCWETHIEEET